MVAFVCARAGLSTVGVFSNVLILSLFLRFRTIRARSELSVLCFLAVSDLWVSLTTFMELLLDALQRTLMCNPVGHMFNVAISISLCFTLYFAVDRWKVHILIYYFNSHLFYLPPYIFRQQPTQSVMRSRVTGSVRL